MVQASKNHSWSDCHSSENLQSLALPLLHKTIQHFLGPHLILRFLRYLSVSVNTPWADSHILAA